MSAIRKPRTYYTLDDYFALEKSTDIRYEYHNGEVVAISGAQPNHNRVAANLVREIGNQLKSSTREVFTSDQRVKVRVGGPYVYPDVSVVCPKAEFERIGGLLALTNPSAIVEVLSPATAEHDRTAKFNQYQTIPTLRDYILVEPDEVLILHYTIRPDGSWQPTEYAGLDDLLPLDSVECRVPLSEVYRNVNFAPSKG